MLSYKNWKLINESVVGGCMTLGVRTPQNIGISLPSNFGDFTQAFEEGKKKKKMLIDDEEEISDVPSEEDDMCPSPSSEEEESGEEISFSKKKSKKKMSTEGSWFSGQAVEEGKKKMGMDMDMMDMVKKKKPCGDNDDDVDIEEEDEDEESISFSKKKSKKKMRAEAFLAKWYGEAKKKKMLDDMDTSLGEEDYEDMKKSCPGEGEEEEEDEIAFSKKKSKKKMQAEGKDWIQKAIKHPGRCKNMGSPECPKGSPQYNLGKRFKDGDLSERFQKGGDLHKEERDGFPGSEEFFTSIMDQAQGTVHKTFSSGLKEDALLPPAVSDQGLADANPQPSAGEVGYAPDTRIGLGASEAQELGAQDNSYGFTAVPTLDNYTEWTKKKGN